MTCGMVSSVSPSSSCSSSVAQLRRMDTQVLRGLHIRHAPFLDQPHSLKLELARKLPSLHDPPPAPSKHLTRCLRNRLQANHTTFELGRPRLATATAAPLVPSGDLPGRERYRCTPSPLD